ncbi:MAG: alpha-E domain-containing protein, partial [Sulfitobacter sp.]|nr:alpha-E domain-containing protein [Sulfitobacter sp.]
MLGKTAGGLYWMFRTLERAENTARLIEAGSRIALTRSTNTQAEWRSVIATMAARSAFEARHSTYDSSNVVDFLLRDVT